MRGRSQRHAWGRIAVATRRARLGRWRAAALAISALPSLGCSGEAFSIDGGLDAAHFDAADRDASTGPREAAESGDAPIDTSASDASADAGARDAGAHDARSDEAALPDGAPPDGPLADASPPDAARDIAPKPPVELNVPIAADADDATWVNGTDERLHFSETNFTLEVGADAEMGRAGLRFQLPIPGGSTIVAARLRLNRVAGEAAPTDTLLVQVFDTTALPPFDDGHAHTPSEHAAVGPEAVSGFLAGVKGAPIDSPDLRALVQRIVDKPDWAEGKYVGFLLSPDSMTSWVAFADSAMKAGEATLRVVYTAP